MTKLIKYFSYFLLFTIVLALLAVSFMQTPIFKNWLKNKLIEMAEARINGAIAIESLRGNLFSYVQIEGLTITSAGKEVFRLKRGFFRYNPYALLRKRISVRQIILESPEFNLVQIDSTHWNFEGFLKPQPASAKTDSAQTFDWPVSAPSIVVAAGAVDVETLGTLPFVIPKRFQNLNLDIGLWLKKGETHLVLEKLSFESRDPDLSFRTSQSKLELRGDDLNAENFEIDTEASKLSSSIAIKNLADPVIDALIQGLPISLTELRRAAPDLELYGDPKIVLKVIGPLNALEVSTRLWMGDNNISLAGNLQLKQPPYQYDFKGEITHLNLADFTRDSTLASDLNFRFDVKGQDVELHKMSGAATVAFDTSDAFGLRFEPLSGRCEIDSARLKFSLQMQSQGAKAEAAGWLNLAEKVPTYRLAANVRDLDVQQFTVLSDFHSNINMNFEIDGRGTDFETFSGSARVGVRPSAINGVPVDTALAQLLVEDKIIRLQEFQVTSPLAKITAAGDISIHKENHLQVDAEFIDFSVLSNVMPLDSLRGRGRFSGRFEGPLDSLLITSSMELSQFAGLDFEVGQFVAGGRGVYSGKGIRFEMDGKVDTTAAFGLNDLRSNFKFDYADSVVYFQIDASRRDDLSASTSGQLRWNATGYDVILEALDLRLLQQVWHKESERTVIRISEEGYSISELQLASNEQTVFVAGDLHPAKGNDLHLSLQSIDLANFQQFLEANVNLSGDLDLDLLLSGTMAKPRLRGDFQISDLEYYQVPFEDFSGLFAFHDDSLNWRAVLSKVATDSLMETSGFVQMKLCLEPYQFQLLAGQPVEIKVSSRGLDLSFLQLFASDVKNIRGTLAADIVLSNTLNDLRGVGPVRVFDGQFDLPTLGTKYRNVNLVLLLQGKEFVIKDFRMQSDGGELRLLSGGLALSEKSLENFKAQFRANNFRIMNDRRMQARVKGDLELSGSIQAPQFSGEITVTESRIYYPAWFEYENLVELSTKPFFIITEDTAVFDTSGAMRFQKKRTAAEDDFTQAEIYKRLRGELAIYFPRNTWIRGEDTNIEVEGELVAVKEGPEIVLFGNFVTIRGYYELLGNRFQITSGEMVFHGEPVPNPEIKIEAVYEFQDASSEDRQKHEFKVLITGSLYTPEFKFTLDDQVAEQGDILSILLFGQRGSNLSLGQAYSTSNETDIEDRATGLVAGQILKQLSGRLGKRLSLDMIQIESGKDITDSKVRIGKYVTQDVFVSVSQDFGAEGNRKVEIEYELPKKLFFLNLLLQASVERQERQGSTGLDVIWKIEW